MTVSKTAIAHNVADVVVASAIYTGLEKVMVDKTEIDKDSIAARVGLGLTTTAAMFKISPYTGLAVDIVAARWQARKERKKNKSEES